MIQSLYCIKGFGCLLSLLSLRKNPKNKKMYSSETCLLLSLLSLTLFSISCCILATIIIRTKTPVQDCWILHESHFGLSMLFSNKNERKLYWWKGFETHKKNEKRQCVTTIFSSTTKKK